MKLKIIADSKIPYLQGVLEPYAEMVYLSPDQIDRDAVRDADALIIRTRTKCDARLLEGSKVKMIATATIGYDHIDSEYCRNQGIVWKNAPGCNAPSVGQYIVCALSMLFASRGEQLKGKTLGIVGCGNVGRAVEAACIPFGINILRCDPPRAEAEGDAGFVSLEHIAREADVITFHTPLTHTGNHPTYHLADARFFGELVNSPVIINSARGEVVDEIALLDAYRQGSVSDMIIDCWEHEPHINADLLAASYLSTPHIAGYSADGKSNATRMAVDNIASFFGLDVDTSQVVPPAAPDPAIDVLLYPENTLTEILLRTYDPSEDSARLLDRPDQFEQQRGDYPLRREFLAYILYNKEGLDPDDLNALLQVGFQEG